MKDVLSAILNGRNTNSIKEFTSAIDRNYRYVSGDHRIIYDKTRDLLPRMTSLRVESNSTGVITADVSFNDIRTNSAACEQLNNLFDSMKARGDIQNFCQMGHTVSRFLVYVALDAPKQDDLEKMLRTKSFDEIVLMFKSQKETINELTAKLADISKHFVV